MNGSVLLIGHGSRDPEGNAEFLELARRVRGLLDGVHVQECFLEFTRPTVEEGIDKCARDGVQEITIVPVMLLPALHVHHDIPGEIRRAKTRHPSVKFLYAANMNIDQSIIDIAHEKIRKAELQLGADRGEISVLLVGRGSSYPEANGDIYKASRILWEQGGYHTMETCFIGITYPALDEGLMKCSKLGYRYLVVMPFMAFTGILVKRVSSVVNQLLPVLNGMKVAVAEHLGVHDNMVDSIVNKLQQNLPEV